MKLKSSTGRKLRYGATSYILTALILLVVMVVNVIFSLCVSRFNWYADLTPEPHFTMSDEFYDLIGTVKDDDITTAIEALEKRREKDKDIQLHIFFMQDEDVLMSSEITKYVVVNAKEIRDKYKDKNYVNIEFIDHAENPKFFNQFKETSSEIIQADSVIIALGTLDKKTYEFDYVKSEKRICPLERFYILGDNNETFAYNAEKTFASAILAVTKTKKTLVCYTTNHNESVPSDPNPNSEAAKDSAFLPLLETFDSANFEIKPIDLSKEEIPEECKIIVVYGPKKDFATGDSGNGEADEIGKLDKFLDEKKALMVFMNPIDKKEPDSMANLEDFLAEWGMEFIYKTTGRKNPYELTDLNSVDADHKVIVGNYADNPLAKGWTESMNTSDQATNSKVLFPNATPIRYAGGYTAGNTEGYWAGVGPTGRIVYDLFTTSTATASVNGEVVEQATSNKPLSLMAVSVETDYTEEVGGMLTTDSFVLLCGTTDFSSKGCMSPAYGNSDFLLSALYLIGKDPVPVGLGYKKFANMTIDTITNTDIIVWTVVLSTIPALAAAVTGTVILIRRKYK